MKLKPERKSKLASPFRDKKDLYFLWVIRLENMNFDKLVHSVAKLLTGLSIDPIRISANCEISEKKMG